jgi:hypothetical protein
VTRKRLYTLVICLSVAGYFWVFWNSGFFGWNEKAPLTCLFKSVTGIPCPSCGSTHAVASILYGDFGRAAHENPLGFIIAALLLVVPVWVALDMVSGRKRFFEFYRKSELLLRKKWVAFPAILFVLIIWILNIHRNL